MTIQFPVPSETFATNEVRQLSRSGVSITVHGLRPARSDAAKLLLDRGVSTLPITHNGIGASLRGVWAALFRPSLLLKVITWIGQANLRKPRDLLISLLLLPRAFDILVEIERRRPDVVHLYWGHYPSLVGYLVQHRLPAIVTSMSIVAYDLNHEYGGTAEVAKRADAIRTHAHVNKELVSHLTGVAQDRINVIYNGVDLVWLEGISAGHERKPRRVFTAGRLIPEKGMDDVLVAFAEVHARWPDATLVVAGDGPDKPRLQALAESLGIGDAVAFLGHVMHARVVEEMAKSEAFVLLSRYGGERLPNAVKEGMACGCICITTPTLGIDELVDHGVTGFVVPMADAKAAAETIDRLFSGRVDTDSIATRAREHVMRHFDLRSGALRYEALWRASIEAKRA